MANDKHQVYLGLGSNLANPEQQISQAIIHITALAKTRLIKQSSLYQSKALGVPNQPDYLNAVIEIETAQSPADLLKCVKDIEQIMGREPKTIRWDARIIDIDILLYDQLSLSSPHLVIPHTEMLRRNFVVFPLLEINPKATLPNGQSIATQAATLPSHDIVRLSPHD